MGDTPHPRQTYVFSRGLYNVHLDAVDPSDLNQIFPFNPSFPQSPGLANGSSTAKTRSPRGCWSIASGKCSSVPVSSKPRRISGCKDRAPRILQLLDWLAVDFMESGWDIKRLNKMIVMSAAYRQASVASDDMEKRDPRTS